MLFQRGVVFHDHGDDCERWFVAVNEPLTHSCVHGRRRGTRLKEKTIEMQFMDFPYPLRPPSPRRDESMAVDLVRLRSPHIRGPPPQRSSDNEVCSPLWMVWGLFFFFSSNGLLGFVMQHITCNLWPFPCFQLKRNPPALCVVFTAHQVTTPPNMGAWATHRFNRSCIFMSALSPSTFLFLFGLLI